MVTVLRIGRILPKNWIAKQFRNAAGFFSFQSNMWEMWKITLNQFKKEAEKDLTLGKDSLNVTIIRDSEKYGEKVIQWLVCKCSSTVPGREEQCYIELDALNKSIEKKYESMKKNNEFSIDKPNSLTKGIFEKSKVAKHKITDVIQKGLNRDGEKTVSDVMLGLDILVEKYMEN